MCTSMCDKLCTPDCAARQERERIIKLLKEQQDKFIERGQFNEYFLIALIKGENK